MRYSIIMAQSAIVDIEELFDYIRATDSVERAMLCH
jgi:hypothetical protein